MVTEDSKAKGTGSPHSEPLRTLEGNEDIPPLPDSALPTDTTTLDSSVPSSDSGFWLAFYPHPKTVQ